MSPDERFSADTQSSRSAMAEAVDPALYVVTVADLQGSPSGCLAGFVTQCSIIPERHLVCLSKLNHTFFVAEQASSLAVHLLGETQEDLAVHFGGLSGDTTDKFASLPWHRGPHGEPILESCAAWVAGTILRRVSVGDHEAFVIAPTAGGRGTMTGTLSTRHLPDFPAGHPPA